MASDAAGEGSAHRIIDVLARESKPPLRDMLCTYVWRNKTSACARRGYYFLLHETSSLAELSFANGQPKRNVIVSRYLSARMHASLSRRRNRINRLLVSTVR